MSTVLIILVSPLPRSSSKLSNWNLNGSCTTPSTEWNSPAVTLRIASSKIGRQALRYSAAAGGEGISR